VPNCRALRERPTSIVKHFDYFLSYAGIDAGLAKEVQDGLKSRGLSCFVAENGLESPKVWTDELQSTLVCSDRVAFLLTKAAITRPWVNLEIGAAWTLGRTIVPLRAGVSDAEFDGLPAPVTKFQAAAFNLTADRESFFDGLVEHAAHGDC
jgi:hypothetical protein